MPVGTGICRDIPHLLLITNHFWHVLATSTRSLLDDFEFGKPWLDFLGMVGHIQECPGTFGVAALLG